jgi:hypothetical protein
MSALADKPDDDSNKVIPFFTNSNEVELPIEKQFTQMMFCQQIQNINLDQAKQLLTELHMLYLGQQAIMVKIAKQDFQDTFKQIKE